MDSILTDENGANLISGNYSLRSAAIGLQNVLQYLVDQSGNADDDVLWTAHLM